MFHPLTAVNMYVIQKTLREVTVSDCDSSTVIHILYMYCELNLCRNDSRRSSSITLFWRSLVRPSYMETSVVDLLLLTILMLQRCAPCRQVSLG